MKIIENQRKTNENPEKSIKVFEKTMNTYANP